MGGADNMDIDASGNDVTVGKNNRKTRQDPGNVRAIVQIKTAILKKKNLGFRCFDNNTSLAA
jgi:hypothetical protein